MSRNPAHLPVLIACLALTACGGDGGGGGGEDDEGRSGTSERAPTDTPDGVAEGLSGTVVFHTQGDKTTVDGWFVPTSGVDPDVDVAGTTILVDDCTLADALSPSRLRHDDMSSANAGTPEGRHVGATLSLTSREGSYSALHAQRLGDTTVYATTERWLRGALPDDLMLHVPASDAFAGLSIVPVPPLEPLILSAPANGVLSEAGQAIEWEPSDDTSDHVVLELTATDVASAPDALASVRCRLLDDGRFSLPAPFRGRLPAEPDGVHVSLIRERRIEAGREEARLLLIQQSRP